MQTYAKRMRTYSGESMEVETVPDAVKDGETEHVLVTHDECVFYANDGVDSAWLAEGEMVLTPKSQGLSIMISDFMCPCHGSLKVNAEDEKFAHLEFKEARVIFHTGANREGY